MTSEVIKQYEAALQRLINDQPASSGVKISRDGVAKAESQKNSSSGKNNFPKVQTTKNKAKRAQTLKDDTNS